MAGMIRKIKNTTQSESQESLLVCRDVSAGSIGMSAWYEDPRTACEIPKETLSERQFARLIVQEPLDHTFTILVTSLCRAKLGSSEVRGLAYETYLVLDNIDVVVSNDGFHFPFFYI